MAGGWTRLIPLVLFLLFVAVFAWVGFQVRSCAVSDLSQHAVIIPSVSSLTRSSIQIYIYSNDLKDRGQKHLERKNIKFDPKGGMRVGVKEVRDEDYSDRQQNYLVKAWNLSTWPEYRSRFWNKDASQGVQAGQSSGAAPRPSPGSRQSTSSKA